MWSTYSLNRDPRWYGQDWAEFRPERWANLISSKATNSMAATAADDGTGTDTATEEGQIGGSESFRDFFMPFGYVCDRADSARVPASGGEGGGGQAHAVQGAQGSLVL